MSKETKGAPDKKAKRPALLGAMSGIVSGIILQPLEVLKVNLILLPKDLHSVRQQNFIASFYNSSRIIFHKEGIKGFYRGLVPATLRSGFAASMFFYSLDRLKLLISRVTDNQNRVDFLSSATARVISSVGTNPLTVMKTRAGVIGEDTYARLFSSMRIIYLNEGLNGFFKGSLTMMLRDFPFGGLFYVTYNYSNRFLDNHLDNQFKFLLSGMIAGVSATALTQPIEIVKSRLMVDTKRKIRGEKRPSIVQLLINIYRDDGFQGYTRGMFPRLIRKPVINASTFFFYEVFNNTIVKKKNSK